MENLILHPPPSQEDVGVNWLHTPDNVLTIVLNKLINVMDYLRFSAVCRSWLSVATQNLYRYCPPTQLPLLMLTTELDHYQQTRSLYSLSKSRLSNFRVPMPHHKCCRGSSHGWLLMVDKDSFEVHLFNPFLSVNNAIELPALTTFKRLPHDAAISEKYLVNVFLSADPAANSGYVVMVLYGAYNRLACFKPGDKTWTLVDNDQSFEHVIYYKDQFHAVSRMGEVMTCDLNHPEPRLSLLAPPAFEYETDNIYLVESRGDLLMVKRKLDYSPPTCFTNGFEVFELDMDTLKWVQVKSLCGRVLFLGGNSSISLSAVDFPGCEQNCIYFTDDNYYWHEWARPNSNYDTGVFNLEDGSIERHYAMKCKVKFPPPIWVEPTLRRRLD